MPVMIQMSDWASPGPSRRLPVPLQPARRVDQRAVLLGEAGRRELEDLGLDLRRIGRVLRAEVLPEPRRLGIQRIHHDEEFQLAQRARRLLPRSGNDCSGLKPWQM